MIWAQEKDRCLELVMEYGGYGDGRHRGLDAQQNFQVRREMEMWVPTMRKEVGALLEKMAIQEVREEEVDRWEREGELKAGDGRRTRAEWRRGAVAEGGGNEMGRGKLGHPHGVPEC